ncbi:MAG: hypothetical protein EBT97_09825, partial [Actinobacteria bacterium]|nr:hypothetical protein [Actinomycetota bacterium]
HNGKSAAVVTNDGNGGATRIDWKPAAKDAKAALEAVIAAHPIVQYDGMDLNVDDGMVMEELVNIAERRKAMRTKTLFLIGDTEYQIKATYDAKVAAYIKGKYPTAVILNEDPAYAVAA